MVLALLLLLSAPDSTAEDSVAVRARAIELYETGQYAESRALLEQLDRDGLADGSLLYRLQYTQRVAGDPAAKTTLERARDLLEKDATGSLEASFYLANAYTALGQPADARRASEQATARVESGQIPEPTDGVGMFWVGKLYSNQENASQAESWYRRALDAFGEPESATATTYMRWARRWLGDRAWDRQDWSGAAELYAPLAEDEKPDPDVLDRLARSCARLGRWKEAAAAWNRVVLLDPDRRDHARCSLYLSRAVGMLELPRTSPDGRAWSALAKDELQSILRTCAAEVAEVHSELGGQPPAADQYARLQGRLDAARSLFVAAAVEYDLRGLRIYDLAMASGYLRLIANDMDWHVPPPP